MTAGDDAAVRAFVVESGAEWLVASCDAADVEALRRRDHHVVVVAGRPALLLAYHLWSDPPPSAPRVYALYGYTEGHPRAPAALQALVDRLAFRRP